MATIVIRDFIYDDLGAPVGGIRARAFAKIGVGSREIVHVGEDFSRSDTGMWELTLDTNTSPTGLFTIEMYNPSTGQIRWRDGHVRLQVEALIGAHGGVPIADQSITAAKIQDGAIINAKISDNALSSTKLQVSDRTVDQNIATAIANTGTLGQLLSWFGKQIRLITGNADWKTAPPTNLSTVFTHMANTNIHSLGSGVALAAPLTSGYVQGTSVPKIAAGSVLVTVSSNLGSFYINTLMNGIICIMLTDGNSAVNTSHALSVESYETSFPDSTNLITFRVYPAVTNNTQIRVNFFVLYW